MQQTLIYTRTHTDMTACGEQRKATRNAESIQILDGDSDECYMHRSVSFTLAFGAFDI